MKYLLSLFLALAGTTLSAQSSALFDDQRICEIRVEMPVDSVLYMMSHLVNDHYMPATFVFVDGALRDTLQEVGVRLRGNTSLQAQKKSFKLSFNEFVSGRKYQGVKKLNLRGSHNDPTMVREKLFYDVWNQAGMPHRRVAFVKFYLNGEYRGLYSNVEEIDKEWLEDAFGVDTGNLYKCTYPADLNYLGDNQATYKAIMNNPEERAYDLSTNETADDYARLVQLIATLNQPVDAAYAENISAILNVQSVLKSFALDIASGNWDDYFYNKNNYYLYDNPATGKFDYFTFDTDNTFGVDWLGKDWAKRNCLSWQKSGEARPLATKLLAVPAFKTQFVHYLDSISRYIVCPDSIFPHINALHNLVTPAAFNDTYRTLDYGYDMGDFHDGFTQTIDNHTPYGIKPFLSLRYDSTLQQIADFLTPVSDLAAKSPGYFFTYPNPATEWLYVQTLSSLPTDTVDCTVFDKEGRSVLRQEWNSTATPYRLPIQSLPAGMYRIYLKAGAAEQSLPFVKGGK